MAMVQDICAGLAMGVALGLGGCDGSDAATNDPVVNGQDSGIDSSIDAADAIADNDLDTGVYVDAEAGEDIGAPDVYEAASDAFDAPIESGPPETPASPIVNFYSDAPCAFPASIAYDPTANALMMACGGATNELFMSPPLGDSGAWSSIGTIGGYPSYHLPLDSRYHVANHSMPDGATIIDAQTGLATAEVAFSALALKDETNQALGFVPNNPTGALLAGGRLCVATSNLDHMDMDPALTTFFPGTVICIPYNGGGTLDTSSARAIHTSGVNPTGMTLIDATLKPDGTQRFAVLSSGGYAPSPDKTAAFDVFTWSSAAQSFTRSSTPLGQITAQISPVMPMTDGGLILFGVQKPDNRLMGIDATTGLVSFDREMPDVQNFIAAVNTNGHVAAASDFGVFGQGGSVLFYDLNANGWQGTPISPLEGSAGPALVIGGVLYQTVTSNDASSGSVWTVDMGGMQ